MGFKNPFQLLTGGMIDAKGQFDPFGPGGAFNPLGAVPPPPPPTPPNPATYASGSVQQGGAQAATQAAAAAGAGFDQTLAGSPQGSGSGNTAKSQLGG